MNSSSSSSSPPARASSTDQLSSFSAFHNKRLAINNRLMANDRRIKKLLKEVRQGAKKAAKGEKKSVYRRSVGHVLLTNSRKHHLHTSPVCINTTNTITPQISFAMPAASQKRRKRPHGKPLTPPDSQIPAPAPTTRTRGRPRKADFTIAEDATATQSTQPEASQATASQPSQAPRKKPLHENPFEANKQASAAMECAAQRFSAHDHPTARAHIATAPTIRRGGGS
ncbi:hypothetical protein B0J12DRAFT_250521 [Macrophomina phaseolina]|uniref:Uncharacterized protein n=1 Tax=Macrophomina phaseolina TaxID=35725 RepID=A0ABQ8G038_9PEZI|nr:hypothetical protein B0J12DRAFT_250521 [Macrophomina phaseolina]